MKGILFKPWKIRWISELKEGEHGVTRRVLKLQPPSYADKAELTAATWNFYKSSDPAFHAYLKGKSRSWLVGEVVYIKESYAFDRFCDNVRPAQVSSAMTVVWYKDTRDRSVRGRGKWRSPLFMPAWAARTFIVILDVRPERLELPLPPEELRLEGGEQALNLLTELDGLWVWRYKFRIRTK